MAGQGQFLCLILQCMATRLVDSIFPSLCIPVDSILDDTVLPHAYCLRGGTKVACVMCQCLRGFGPLSLKAVTG